MLPKRTFPHEYEMNTSPVCPHCEHEFKPDDYVEGMYDDGAYSDITCPSCDKPYVSVTSVSFYYSTAVSEQAASDDEWGPKDLETEEST